MALLQATSTGKLNIVALNKALFYMDLAALRDLGHTVTGQKYIALPQGPVVAAYDRKLVRDLKNAGLAEQVQDGRAKPMVVRHRIETFQHLAPFELELARSIGAFIGNYTSTFLSTYSHMNPGWQLARAAHVEGAPGKEIDLLVAMQQLAQDDEDETWIDEPVDEDLASRVAGAASASSSWQQ